MQTKQPVTETADFWPWFEGVLAAHDIPQKAVAANLGQDATTFSKGKRKPLTARHAFRLGMATQQAARRPAVSA